MDKDLQSIFEFLKLARELQTTYRFTAKPKGDMENDAEHSWSVAFICMILASRLEKEFDRKLDQTRMLKMALIHDIAEIQTGDTRPWETEMRMHKEEKERTAIQSMLELLPVDVASEMLVLWEECEKKETLEAKIVKSIDRLDPVLHRTAFRISWKGSVEDEYATVPSLDERQYPRHSFSETMTKLYEIIRTEAIAEGMFKIS